MTVEAFLSYCPSRYVLSSCPDDGINAYVLPLVVHLTSGKKLLLGPLYLGSLHARLDECIQNFTSSVGHYDVVTHVYSAFLKIFLWERFGNIATKPLEFDPVTTTDEMVDGKVKKTKSTT